VCLRMQPRLSADNLSAVIFLRRAPTQLQQVVRTFVPTTIWQKLILSLVIDLIGSSSYLIPVAGEAFDPAWAPIQTIIIMAMYNEAAPNLKYVSFAEELLPFTDIIPSATAGWLTEFGLPLVQEQLLGKKSASGAGATSSSSSSSKPLIVPETVPE